MSNKNTGLRAPSKRPAARDVRLVKVRAKNQLTLPQAMLEELGVQEGELLKVTRAGRGLHLERVVDAPPETADKKEPLGAALAKYRSQVSYERLVPGRGPRGRGWTREDAYE